MELRRCLSPAFAASASAPLIELCLARLLRFFEVPTGREPWSLIFTLTGLSRRRPSNSGTINPEISGQRNFYLRISSDWLHNLRFKYVLLARKVSSTNSITGQKYGDNELDDRLRV